MSNKQKLFVILSPGFAASEEDSSCLPMLQAFVRALSRDSADVGVIVLSFHYPFVKMTYDWFGVSVTSFNGRNKGGIQGILLRKSVERALERIHQDYEIVGVLSFWLGESAMVGKRFSEKKGLRHYCWILGQDARIGNKYVKSLLIEGKELIALSDSLQEEFERNYGIRPEKVISPGIEIRTNCNGQKDIDLLAVGSLIPLKRFELFLEAVTRIKKELPAIKAVLVGEGPEYDRLKNMANDFGLSDTVSFTGAVGHHEVFGIMARTKVLLHPSEYEGYSGVCQEALSIGAHVVSFCRAMNEDIRQWHIVQTKKEMIEKVVAILKDGSTKSQPIEFAPMTCTAQQIMDLYRSKETLRRNTEHLEIDSCDLIPNLV
ncbi:MAG TPA: glycosyltransferase [Flavisolibacter sp.]